MMEAFIHSFILQHGFGPSGPECALLWAASIGLVYSVNVWCFSPKTHTTNNKIHLSDCESKNLSTFKEIEDRCAVAPHGKFHPFVTKILPR